MDYENQPLYKKIQDYVFAFYDKVGKGNFSQVFKGIHEPSRILSLTIEKHVAIKVVELSSLNSQRLQ